MSAVPRVCFADLKGSVTSSQGVRDPVPKGSVDIFL